MATERTNNRAAVRANMAVAGVQYRETDTREMDGAWDTR